MKLFPTAKSQSGHPKNESMSAHKNHRPALHDASHYPRHLQCIVRGPDGKRFALVPIWMPLSIMSSYAVKAAGRSDGLNGFSLDEVASMASVAVIAQGNAIIKNIREGGILNEEDVFGCIDAVARNTRDTLLRTVGDRKIADEVEAMIRGGGELILNSNRGDFYDESRDDQALCDDVQSIATTILNNFDSDMMSTSYGMMSEYATNDSVANKNRKALDSTTCSQSISSSTTTCDPLYSDPERIQPVFGWSALLPAWTWDARHANLSTQLTESSTGQVSLSYLLKNQSELETPKHATPSFDPTWDTSKNASLYAATNDTSMYETASTFNMDTFSPIPSTFYRTSLYELPECPNLSMEPALDRNTSIALDASHNGNTSLIPNTINSGCAANMGPGIFAITSNNDTSVMLIDNNVTDIMNDQNTEFGQSITTKSIQSQMKEKGCCSCNVKYSCPETTPHTEDHIEDQRSTSSPMTQTYQSYVEPGKEVDDITFLKAQTNNEKKSFLKRTKVFLRNLNCAKGSK
eukprot:CCRYP_011070-RA/>CCRYP_011070-RA protein AED:0.41 eAED:0.41 QI:0/-1/0/1/-1/1/1/0/519